MRLYVALILVGLMAMADVEARRSGSSSFSSRSSSSFRSSTRSSSTRSTKPAPTKTVTKTTTTSRTPTQKSTFTSKTTTDTKKATTKTAVKSKNKIDRKMKKQLASKDKEAFKKYPNKTQATQAYKQKLAEKHKYTNPTPPATRPKEIPQNIDVGGRSVNVTYNVLPGGGYGYGYIDPLTMAFIALQPRYYVVDPYDMRMAGYGQWDASGRPVHPTNANDVKVAFIVVGGIVVLVGGGLLVAKFLV